MKNIFTKANALMVLSHLKNNAVRYTVASSIVTLLGLATTETAKVEHVIEVMVNVLSMAVTSMVG